MRELDRERASKRGWRGCARPSTNEQPRSRNGHSEAKTQTRAKAKQTAERTSARACAHPAHLRCRRAQAAARASPPGRSLVRRVQCNAAQNVASRRSCNAEQLGAPCWNAAQRVCNTTCSTVQRSTKRRSTNGTESVRAARCTLVLACYMLRADLCVAAGCLGTEIQSQPFA